MNDAELQEIREAIEVEITAAQTEIERLQQHNEPVAPDNAIGRLTRMEAINENSIRDANLRRTQARLQRLQRALKRIDDDPDFGICAACERPIPIARMKFMPESTMCVRCAERRT